MAILAWILQSLAQILVIGPILVAIFKVYKWLKTDVKLEQDNTENTQSGIFMVVLSLAWDAVKPVIIFCVIETLCIMVSLEFTNIAYNLIH